MMRTLTIIAAALVALVVAPVASSATKPSEISVYARSVRPPLTQLDVRRKAITKQIALIAAAKDVPELRPRAERLIALCSSYSKLGVSTRLENIAAPKQLRGDHRAVARASLRLADTCDTKTDAMRGALDEHAAVAASGELDALIDAAIDLIRAVNTSADAIASRTAAAKAAADGWRFGFLQAAADAKAPVPSWARAVGK